MRKTIGITKQTVTKAEPLENLYKDANEPSSVYQEPKIMVDLKSLAEKIFSLPTPTKQDIERCLKIYLGVC